MNRFSYTLDSTVPLTWMKTLVTFGEINLCKSIHQPCGISSRANSNPTSSWYLGMGIVFNFKTFKVLGSFRDSTRPWDVCRNSNFHWCMLDKFGVTLCPNFSTKILSAITYVYYAYLTILIITQTFFWGFLFTHRWISMI